MKTLRIYFTIIIFSCALMNVQAQNEIQQQWEQQKEQIIAQEKESLKKVVIAINQRFERKEISKEEAEHLKKEAAEKHARNIRNRLKILRNTLELKDRNTDHNIWDENTSFDKEWTQQDNFEKDYEDRTSSDIVLAFGFSNALREGETLEESEFKIGGSRFFEIGWAWTTRVFKKSNWLRLRYGFSLQFNGLKPTENRYYVQEEGLTFLEEFPHELNKSKFRMDNLVFPVFFEIGPSSKTETSRDVYFSTQDKLKIGIGGYAGYNIAVRQKLKYELNGEKIKEKLKNDYNTNDFIYGLSAYIGWEGVALYGKYDLSTIFESPNPEMHNFSLGLRLDVD